ncbi:hypothetical protein TorRG33x02_337830 [Trema orientale]|uniref:Uncharacterized protein n=1 Tax=Trema orientale TaxID=63057 RepID=A0A2P5AYC0_TREOI|nr:hypothetical protein TorRG33x02_337830 [Trema orientale]
MSLWAGSSNLRGEYLELIHTSLTPYDSCKDKSSKLSWKSVETTINISSPIDSSPFLDAQMQLVISRRLGLFEQSALNKWML